MIKLTPELTKKIKTYKQMDVKDRTKLENEISESIRNKNNKNYSKTLDSLSDDQLKKLFKVTLSIIKTS
ncbi:hypothetical protein QI283_03235 [Staphylococcus saprophyticus]|uniref:DUF7366 family protein n=1 Tax=Staphylococcus saprophyticus TaxID=29385 RepID=UPI0010108118|nr:hypothetical protein [Staphylococcus saprophyticus]MDW3939133.1 hypothetical protein [Staphylococcus saprophyticus]MDW4212565.1 hypothetical protein [Staphylococcus saprophyticus]MDW4227550.1 hypothetical protein [Staphylococcus saprophyticus]MDW4281717.1 hypothetical protein [Staphylococcus saprophyticus]MDW4362587.1 hypothetical protein [Staphylococcus saprophyticus]